MIDLAAAPLGRDFAPAVAGSLLSSERRNDVYRRGPPGGNRRRGETGDEYQQRDHAKDDRIHRGRAKEERGQHTGTCKAGQDPGRQP